jgi:hypothetical protein
MYRSSAYSNLNIRCWDQVVLSWDGMLHNVLLDTTGKGAYGGAASAVMATLPCCHVAVLLRCGTAMLPCCLAATACP